VPLRVSSTALSALSPPASHHSLSRYNICTGQRCVCTFDTHLRRRIALCFDELGEVEAEKRIAREVIRQTRRSHPRTPPPQSTSASTRASRLASPSRTGRTPSGDTSSRASTTGMAQRPPSPAPGRDLVTPRGSLSRSQSFPPPPPLPPAHQSLAPTPSRPHPHEATPDRRRKEAVLKVRGAPTHHPLSRWSLSLDLPDPIPPPL
jgi:hypothetical protein